MIQRVGRFLVWGLVVLAGVYLGFLDYSEKLDTDVSALLPEVDTAEARIARNLISEEQGRGVYLELTGASLDSEVELAFLAGLERSEWVESWVRFDEQANLSALSFVNEHRLELLFPKWLAEMRRRFAESGEADFNEWASEESVAEMDAFLASPAAMELARDELMDPLLLSIGALLRMSDGGGQALQENEEDADALLYWLRLGESPLARETQEGLAMELGRLEEQLQALNKEVSLSYGGLVRLASASRERIQKDVFKINILSLAGVVLTCGLLARRPWRLLWALPALVAGFVGALSVSFLVFGSVNVVVLVVGAILIGTSIDYAVHLIFKDQGASGFPTNRLVGFACFSTVAGFGVLLLADLELVRQIGVFVGAGLLSAYLMARVSIAANNVAVEAERDAVPTGGVVRGWLSLSVLALLAGVWGVFELQWVDDLRAFEAPDPSVVEDDLALRARFGGDGGGSVILTTGASYLDVAGRESEVLKGWQDTDSGIGVFGFSMFVPDTGELEELEAMSEDLPNLFESLRSAFEEAGYEAESFERFFEAGRSMAADGMVAEQEVEGLIAKLAKRLAGPLKGMLGHAGDRYWSLSTVAVSSEVALTEIEGREGSTLFSQLTFLNLALEKHRETLLEFGIGAALLVGVVVFWGFGLKRGALIVLYPIFGGLISVGICSLAFGALNLFHLIGCFLGGAIALDYALFAIEAYGRGVRLPRSVWLSAGTTTASFLALGLSSVPVVRGLGWVVALLSCATLLLLHSSQWFLRRYLGNE